MNNDMNNAELNQIHLQDMVRMAREDQARRALSEGRTARQSLLGTIVALLQTLFR